MVMMSFVGAVLGSILGLVFKGLSLTVIGFIIGLLSGVISIQINNLLLGVITGGVIGLLASTFLPELNPAILGALVVFTYRLISAILFGGQENIQLMAERVPRNEIRYVVPFEANSKYVGADYSRIWHELRRGYSNATKRGSAS